MLVWPDERLASHMLREIFFVRKGGLSLRVWQAVGMAATAMQAWDSSIAQPPLPGLQSTDK